MHETYSTGGNGMENMGRGEMYVNLVQQTLSSSGAPGTGRTQRSAPRKGGSIALGKPQKLEEE